MRARKILTFTFIVNFRGGTYCSQVQSVNINTAAAKWIKDIEQQQDQIKHLGKRIIEQLKKEIKDEINDPVPLEGLKSIWYAGYSTSQGTFHINIVQTDIP